MTWTEKLNLDRDKLGEWFRSFDWNQTREKVNQESRARVLLLGLKGAGKSTLFNCLCGWSVSPMSDKGEVEAVEDYGLFCLVDLPYDLGTAGAYESLRSLNGQSWGDYNFHWEGLEHSLPLGALDPLELAGGADLLIYVLDGVEGVRPADYRWVGRLRRLGLPLLVVLNKVDRIERDLATHQAEIEARLATTVLSLSALSGEGVAEELLPRMTHLCPQLTIALGRQLGYFRRQAAERLIRQAALINGLVALEPLPLIDLPVQMITLANLMLRLAALYDRPPTEVRRREVIMAVAGGLAGRYGAQQVAKLVPVVGWLASGLIGWSCTWGLGRAAVAYFEGGGDEAIDRRWRKTRSGLSGLGQAVQRRWEQRPRLRLQWGPARVQEDRQRLPEQGSVEQHGAETGGNQENATKTQNV